MWMAGSVGADTDQVPLRTTGKFNTEDEIRWVLAAMSPAGQPSCIGDFVQLEHHYRVPESRVRHGGKPAVLISVEMQKGNPSSRWAARLME